MRRPFTWGSTVCFVRAPSDAKFVAMPWANREFKVTFADIKNAFKYEMVTKLGTDVGAAVYGRF